MTKLDPVIDLDKELADLFEKEDVFGFFDVSLTMGAAGTISGICKVSKPRGAKSEPKYFSLLFIIDIPDKDVKTEVEKHVSGIDWNAFVRISGNVQRVLPMMPRSLPSGTYFKEVYIYPENMAGFSKQYVFERLYPSIPAVTGFRTGEMVFWDSIGESAKGAGGPGPENLAQGKEKASFLERIRNILGLAK